MKILMKVGDDLYLDYVNTQQNAAGEVLNTEVCNETESSNERYYCAYSMNWPYFAFADISSYIYLYNAFNPNLVQRFELPKCVKEVMFTYLTDTKELFALSNLTTSVPHTILKVLVGRRFLATRSI